MVTAVGGVAGAAFRGVSRARGTKSLHPRGHVYEGVLRIDGGEHAPTAAPLLATPGEHRALVRFSRSIGLPRPLPDLLGAAIRLPDVHGPGRHQDFLVVTSVDAPVLHHVFVPVRNAHQAPYSSSLPYRAGDELFLVGLVPEDGERRFGFAIAPLLGRFRTVGELRVGERAPDDCNAIRFDPWNTGGGLEPAGFLNALRRFAYPDSQAGWAGARTSDMSGAI